MNQEPVYIFATWRVKAGQLDAVLKLLPEIARKSRGEEGNLIYKIHQSNSDKNTLILYELYKNEAAVAAHRGSEHFQSIVLGKIVSLLENRESVLASELEPV
jgi:(4S)-4-hydroxy-5-phosphonooxypentane-2,3-dione isomerase